MPIESNYQLFVSNQTPPLPNDCQRDEEAGVKNLVKKLFSPTEGSSTVTITDYQATGSGLDKADIKNSNGADIGDLLKYTDDKGHTHFMIKSHAADKPEAANGFVVYDAGTDLSDGQGTLFRHSGKKVDIRDLQALLETGSRQKQLLTNVGPSGNAGCDPGNDFSTVFQHSRMHLRINSRGEVRDPSLPPKISGTYTTPSETEIFREGVEARLQARKEQYIRILKSNQERQAKQAAEGAIQNEPWDVRSDYQKRNQFTEKYIATYKQQHPIVDDWKEKVEYERLMAEILRGEVAGLKMPEGLANYESYLLEQHPDDPAMRAQLRDRHKASMEASIE